MIPDYQSLMLPVLACAEKESIQTRHAIMILSEKIGLSDEECALMLPSGKQRIFDNRVHWAKTYLKQAGLLSYPRRGYFEVTEEGRKVLTAQPDRIDVNYLKKYPSFLEFQSRKGDISQQTDLLEKGSNQPEATPDEVLRIAHKQITSALADELLEKIRAGSPDFFENLIIDLLLAMGYGGTSEDAAKALGQSGDNGIDGVVDQDPLGVDQIYIQAKRYAAGNTIGSSDIRDFFGALNLKRAQKGIFFTTSHFSAGAIRTAKDLGMRIVLIDGQQLTKLMTTYNIGCRDVEVLHLKKIDESFFE